MTRQPRRSGPPLRRPRDLAAEAGPPRRAGPAGADPASWSWPPTFAAGPPDRAALMVLLSLPSLTALRLLELAQDEPTASGCLAAVRAGRAGSRADRAAAGALDPGRIAARVRASGARLVPVHGDGYPQGLLDLYDPPAGLFVRGRDLPPLVPGVAIVGARNCSPGGWEMAVGLGAAMARSGGSVISGAARGIDAAAHQGALDAGGGSIAVLGSGIDIAYPRHNRRLIERLASTGAVLSEYPPGTPAEPFRFPARNRLVAALSSAVVVVEGAAGSGSMITADHALDLGREVFAVPGFPTSELATVPLRLIREGATLIRGPRDLLSDLGREAGPGGWSGPAQGPEPGPEHQVWNALTVPSAPDRVASTTGLALPSVIATLVGLEVRGMVRQVGGRYERTGLGAAPSS